MAPGLFFFFNDTATTEIGDGTVPPHLVDLARLAVANCPEFAIELLDDAPDVPTPL
jgi:ferredoxin